MINIMFVCHGNICRSPMAEFVLRDMVNQKGLSKNFYIASSATSREEIGNPVHSGTRKKLAEYNISVLGKTAVQLTKKDYNQYDYIIGMDKNNIKNILKIFGNDSAGKVHLLLDYIGEHRDIADPWYTGDFDSTYNDVYRGCSAFLNHILSNGK